MSVLDRRPVFPEVLPPLQQLQRVNGALPPAQEIGLRTFLQDCQSYMDALATELLYLHGPARAASLLREMVKSSIRGIEKETRRTERLLLLYRPFLSARRRVPPEIWACIFTLCLPPPPDIPAMKPSAPPLSLCYVCSEWRMIAEREYRLWHADLSFYEGSTTWQTLLSRIRTGNILPWHATLTFAQSGAVSWDRRHPEIAEFVRATASHWRRLQYTHRTDSFELYPLDNSILFAPMPQLDSLVLNMSALVQVTEPHPPLLMPNLRSLTLEYDVRNHEVLERKLVLQSWPNLRELVVRCYIPPSSPFWTVFFDLTPTLEHLSLPVLCFTRPDPQPTANDKKVSTGRLKSLEIFGGTLNSLEQRRLIQFLGSYRLSSLQTLSFVNRGHRSHFVAVGDLFTFLAQMCCPLATLTFYGFTLVEAQLLSHAVLFPTLRDIRVRSNEREVNAPNLLQSTQV